MFQRFAAAVVLVAAIAVPSFALAADWRPMAEAEVGLTFEMPGQPERKVAPLDEGDAKPTVSYLLRGENAPLYIVQISQAAQDLDDPVAVGDTGVEVMKNELEGITLVSDEGVNKGPVYYRRTVAKAPEDGMAAQITIVHKRTLIVVVYLQPTGTTLSADATRFLDSLALKPR